MPLYHLECPEHGKQKRLLTHEQFKAGLTCRKCGKPAKHVPQGASASLYETLDNGLQARATVRPADAERIFKERAMQHDLEYGEPEIADEDFEPFDNEPLV